jgi:hypothetical protein
MVIEYQCCLRLYNLIEVEYNMVIEYQLVECGMRLRAI